MNAEVDLFNLVPEELLKQLRSLQPVLFNADRLSILLDSYPGTQQFTQLMADLGLTSGALATHLKALSEAGLVKTFKESQGTKEKTAVIITPDGYKAAERFFNVICRIGVISYV